MENDARSECISYAWISSEGLWVYIIISSECMYDISIIVSSKCMIDDGEWFSIWVYIFISVCMYGKWCTILSSLGIQWKQCQLPLIPELWRLLFILELIYSYFTDLPFASFNTHTHTHTSYAPQTSTTGSTAAALTAAASGGAPSAASNPTALLGD